MKHNLAILFLAAAFALSAAPPIPVIFDTDMGNDIDDALALAMLHGLESRGEIRLVAVTVTKDNPWAPRYVSAVNTFYGRAGIPIGMVKNGVTKDEGKYLRKAIEAGHYPYSDQTQDAVELLRKTLTAQADGSVVIIQVGFSTNLARLLVAPGGRELAARKVKLLSLMAGDFTNHGPEYNVKEDVPSAKKLVADWPTPTVWSGYEIGQTIKFPAHSIDHDFAWSPKNPVVDGYKNYMKFPYDRETWDLTAVLYALRPDAGYFTLSQPGRVAVDDKGFTKFQADPKGRDRYLILNDIQRARVLDALIWLATQPVH
ncbi:nucleoside hydrolase [uncultured Paludibaculum sp.]|uniref:nucleoside hydrolase n=1 Tax=uncultured Paludibaculum sp. TaxID=1765020 RepID=UPI002AABC916|nr:nucleoside hydrolase [uncultured Paludibaculum sp.]